MKKNITKIMIVEDHPIVSDGITQLINREEDLKVTTAVVDAETAISELAKARPDLMIIDISLKGAANGIDLLKGIKKRYKNIKALVLSMHDEAIYAERAIKAGANGYVMKNDLTDNIIKAIRTILDGNLYLSEIMKTRIINNLNEETHENYDDSLKILSDREFQIFQLIAQGNKTTEISTQLNISSKTVEAHRLKIRNKLKLNSSSDLFRFALEWQHTKKTFN